MNIDNRFFKTPANDIKLLETQIFLGVGRVSNLNFSNEKNKNCGFSLIEMIVVVAIMAVMVVVLAPSLLTYNERSRAEKDNASMDELVNAVQLALADSEVYDEVLRFSTVDNVSCYVDTNSESNYSRIVTKANPDGIDQYTFLSDARTLDETPYFAAGNMRGVTLTFAPDKGSNGSTFDLKQGVVNQYIQVSNNQRIGAMPKLYNAVRSTIGDTIVSDSQTYRNSEYTIFVRLGTTGGNDASQQDAIQAYGQWSGTNLPAQVSYQIVSDRTVGDTGNTIVDIDDNNWNETNGNKITLKPGDLNGGGSFTPGTPTGNKDFYTAEDFSEDEKGIYAYLVNGDTLVLRNSPRENMSDVTKDYGMLNASHGRKWATDIANIEFVNIETPILPKSCSYWFQGCTYLKEVTNANYICMDQCTRLDAIFCGCKNLERVDVSNWNTSKVTTIHRVFSSCEKLEEIDVSKWNTSNVTDMSWTFGDCYSVTKLDVSNWDTSKAVNMLTMFTNCKSLKEINTSNWNTSNVTNMNAMFNSCKELKEIDVSNWNTSNVTDMSSMFAACSALTKLDVSKWNTANVKNMRTMFSSCSSLEELDVSNFNTSNVTDMWSTFANCSSLSKIDVSKWNTSNVKNMQTLFAHCKSLKELDVSNWNISNCTTFYYTFQNCSQVEYLEMKNWNIKGNVNLDQMFRGCEKLKELHISHWDVSEITRLNWTFAECKSLTELDLSDWDVSKITELDATFSGCNSLKVLDIGTWNPENITKLQSTFSGCNSLEKLEIGHWNTSNLTSMHYIFANCKNLTNIDISNWDASNVTRRDCAFLNVPFTSRPYNW